jgi:hypothetical protein
VKTPFSSCLFRPWGFTPNPDNPKQPKKDETIFCPFWVREKTKATFWVACPAEKYFQYALDN